MKRLFVLLLVLSSVVAFAQADPKPAKTWSFAVSGDSRNCGDVVMPAIAADARQHDVAFYWHLGDLRKAYDIDEDMLNLAGKPRPTISGYLDSMWDDFIEHQIAPWHDTPFFVGIGNHELYTGYTREQFLIKFANWLNDPVLREQRMRDNPHDYAPHTYYHWVRGGVDFVFLDNASHDQFDPAQMKWIEGVLKRATADPAIRTIVVGAHATLPYSFSFDHSMNDWAQGEDSGMKVYNLLLDAKVAGKNVYLVASHSHYYVTDAFATDFWKSRSTVLPGWIVGSAGAIRYPLPKDAPAGSKTDTYGYLLATVDPAGAVRFDFREVQESGVPPEVAARYAPGFVHWCFVENKAEKK
jgi:hypothetical protein